MDEIKDHNDLGYHAILPCYCECIALELNLYDGAKLNVTAGVELIRKKNKSFSIATITEVFEKCNQMDIVTTKKCDRSAWLMNCVMQHLGNVLIKVLFVENLDW